MPFDPLTVVFAVVALLVIWKLNSVLGRNTGFQRPRPDSKPDKNAAGEPGPVNRLLRPRRLSPQGGTPDRDASRDGSNVIRLPGGAAPGLAADRASDPARWDRVVEPGSAAPAGLDAIAQADRGFAAEPFLDGARTAYEAIITAFAAGERRTLQNLLARDVYDGFNAAIVEREKKKETLSTTFVSIDDAKFNAASLEGTVARVTVRFLSKQISATRGSDGALRDGSPDAIYDMDDLWTFSRDTRSRDPNWKLVATDSGR